MGSPMAGSATNGVVDALARVFKEQGGSQVYEDLCVMDGSLIPRALGVNLSLMISALAFRTAVYIQSKEWR